MMPDLNASPSRPHKVEALRSGLRTPISKGPHHRHAEGVGFEPTEGFLSPSAIFKTAALNHSCHPSMYRKREPGSF